MTRAVNFINYRLLTFDDDGRFLPPVVEGPFEAMRKRSTSRAFNFQISPSKFGADGVSLPPSIRLPVSYKSPKVSLPSDLDGFDVGLPIPKHRRAC
jgi:hypothetical protein